MPMPAIERKHLSSSIPAVAVSAEARALGVESLEVVADPGSGNTLTPPEHKSFSCTLANTAGTRTLGDAQYPGQIAVFHGGGGNTPAVTPQTGNWDGTNPIARLNNDTLIVAGLVNGGWRVIVTDASLFLI